MKTLTIILLFVGLLFGCEKIEYGTIVGKLYEPENQHVSLFPIVISTGKVTSIIMVPFMVYDYEDWLITVIGLNKNGDTIEKTFYVDKIQYDTLSIGQYICINGVCNEDNNNIKVKQ